MSTETRFVNCEHCGTEGRIFSGRANDPNPIDAGPCPACDGECVVEIEVEPATLEDTQSEPQSDYARYRGKCKEMSEALVAADPTLTLVRGHYHCPLWGAQPHWWTRKPDGTVVDPTKDQFPSRGIGDYIEFDGTIECSNCGKEIKEDEADIEGRYAFCSYECHGRFVGAF